MATVTLFVFLLLSCIGPQIVQGQTSVDLGVEAGKNGDPAISAGISHQGKDWSGSGKGILDTKGNWAAAGELNRNIGGWDAGISGGLDSDKNWNAGASIGRSGKNWSAGIGGTTDSRGNFGVRAGFSLRFRRSSLDWSGKHYTVTLHADPCDFRVYDMNRDGVIVKSELHAIFGNEIKAEYLFNALDVTTGDGQIEEDEFYLMSRVFINGCETPDKHRQRTQNTQ